MTRIVLVRHGHVPGIQPERFRGRTDLALTELGLRQARATATRISQHWQVSIVYTSPLQRCVATGQIIAQASGTHQQSLPELTDLDYGDWQGCTHAEIQSASPGLYTQWLSAPALHRFPSGESLQDLAARVTDALRLMLARDGQGSIVVVAHDSTQRVLLLQALGLPLSAYWRIAQSPCAVSELTIEADATRVQRMNETAHLGDLEGDAAAARA